MTAPATAPDRSGSRALGAIAVLLAAGAALVLWSGSMVWLVRVIQRTPPLPEVGYSLTGNGAVPMLTALGVVALAAIVAVLATGPVGRRIVAVALLAVAGWTAVQAVQWFTASGDETVQVLQEDGTKHAAGTEPEPSAWAFPTAVTGCAMIIGAAGGLPMAAGRLPRMGSKYERGGRPAKPVEADSAARDRDLWSSIDRGEDPTD